MNWKHLDTEQALEGVISESHNKPVMLFKHSNRCSISAAALSRIERAWPEKNPDVSAYLVDVIRERPVSNQIARQWEIDHQSPQVLLIKNGRCIYHASHFSIQLADVVEAIGNE